MKRTMIEIKPRGVGEEQEWDMRDFVPNCYSQSDKVPDKEEDNYGEESEA